LQVALERKMGREEGTAVRPEINQGTDGENVSKPIWTVGAGEKIEERNAR